MLEAKHRQDIETEAKEGAVGYLATGHESFECGLWALFVFIGRCVCQNQPDVYAVNYDLEGKAYFHSICTSDVAQERLDVDKNCMLPHIGLG